jgi:hypothetical protein
MKSVMPLGTIMFTNVTAALDYDVVFADATNVFLDAEDDYDEDSLEE